MPAGVSVPLSGSLSSGIHFLRFTVPGRTPALASVRESFDHGRTANAILRVFGDDTGRRKFAGGSHLPGGGVRELQPPAPASNHVTWLRPLPRRYFVLEATLRRCCRRRCHVGACVFQLSLQDGFHGEWHRV